MSSQLLCLFCASDPQAEAVLKSQYNGTLLKRSTLIYANSLGAMRLCDIYHNVCGTQDKPKLVRMAHEHVVNSQGLAPMTR